VDGFGEGPDDLARVPARRIGELLGAARRNAGLEVDLVAARAGVGARRLRRWERGVDAPSADEIERIAHTLGTTASELIPERDPVEYTPAANLITVGGRTAEIVPAEDGDANERVLDTYLNLVAEVRGVSMDRPFALRHDDIEILATLLNLDDRELDDRLARKLGVGLGAARDVRRRISRQRMVVSAASMTMGLLAMVPFAHQDHSASVATERKPVEIGSALMIERAQQPADGSAVLGDVYTYER
jgi:transcriptional regulator with XRE-family HTH domain